MVRLPSAAHELDGREKSMPPRACRGPDIGHQTARQHRRLSVQITDLTGLTVPVSSACRRTLVMGPTGAPPRVHRADHSRQVGATCDAERTASESDSTAEVLPVSGSRLYVVAAAMKWRNCELAAALCSARFGPSFARHSSSPRDACNTTNTHRQKSGPSSIARARLHGSLSGCLPSVGRGS
jgi:hypothetical protein